MRPAVRFRLLAFGIPAAAFLLVFGTTLLLGEDGAGGADEGRAATPAPGAHATGEQLVFTLSAGSSEPAEGYLATAGLDGAGLSQITEPPEGGLAADVSPAVSPDGQTIAFARAVPGEPPHVWLVGTDGSGLRRLSDTPDAEIAPAWSPDGTRIAFSRAVGDRFELFVADADGSNPVRLTRTPRADEDGASWSPNGAQIAFTRFARDDEDLWVVDADGADPHALVRGRHEDSSPAWSPDGARIAIVRDGRIALFTFERFDVAYLTPSSAVKDAGPAWSPDGTHIVFTRDPGSILVMDDQGTNPMPVPLDGRATGAVWAAAP
jgi:Tol biopolymer transport system component